MGPFKREAVFHLVLVVIGTVISPPRSLGNSHVASRPAVAVIVSFGVAWTTQIRAYLSSSSPHTEMFSLLEHDLSDSFHATCSKGELIKGPFK